MDFMEKKPGFSYISIGCPFLRFLEDCLFKKQEDLSAAWLLRKAVHKFIHVLPACIGHRFRPAQMGGGKPLKPHRQRPTARHGLHSQRDRGQQKQVRQKRNVCQVKCHVLRHWQDCNLSNEAVHLANVPLTAWLGGAPFFRITQDLKRA